MVDKYPKLVITIRNRDLIERLSKIKEENNLDNWSDVITLLVGYYQKIRDILNVVDQLGDHVMSLLSEYYKNKNQKVQPIVVIPVDKPTDLPQPSVPEDKG